MSLVIAAAPSLATLRRLQLLFDQVPNGARDELGFGNRKETCQYAQCDNVDLDLLAIDKTHQPLLADSALPRSLVDIDISQEKHALDDPRQREICVAENGCYDLVMAVTQIAAVRNEPRRRVSQRRASTMDRVAT